jgi:phage gp36-like protein
MPGALYCTADDLLLPGEALAELQDADVERAITTASAEADSYLSSRWTLPLKPPSGDVDNPEWPADLVNAVAQIATYRAMARRGYAPMAGQNDSIYQGYKDAKAFLKDVSAGTATLQVAGSSTDAAAQEGGGPSGAAYVTQPDAGPGGSYRLEEDFWHDSLSATGGGGAFRGSRRRGY